MVCRGLDSCVYKSDWNSMFGILYLLDSDKAYKT